MRDRPLAPAGQRATGCGGWHEDALMMPDDPVGLTALFSTSTGHSAGIERNRDVLCRATADTLGRSCRLSAR